MDLVASVQFPDVEYAKSLGNRPNICTVSKKNLLAFSAPRCYKLQRGPSSKLGLNEEKHIQTFRDFGGAADMVFVCSLAAPWNVYHITHTEFEIRHIVWDSSGTKLLLADAAGQIFLWQMHESLLNYWTLSNISKGMSGDDIIALKWINSSQMFTIAKDVREQVVYEKKFPLAGASPPIGYFGGKSVDYWVAVTSSGVVGVGIIQQKTEMVVAKACLECFENKRISCADIVMESDGSVQIVTTTGQTKDPIRLHKLTTDISSHGYIIQPNSFSVQCSGYSCFFVDKCTEMDAISSLCYVQPANGHTVLVTIDKPHGTEIQQWTMCEETLGLHTAFHANPLIPERNFYWIRQTSVQLTSYVTSTATVPLLTDNTALFPLGAAFSCDDKTILLTSRQSLSDMNSCPAQLPEDSDIRCLAISPNGCVCVAITNKCEVLIYGECNLTIEHICVLLERSVITGTGWEDVLMCIKSENGMYEKILQSLEMSFSKQSLGMQTQLKNRFLTLKIGLSIPNEPVNGYSVDLLTILMVNHVRNIFMSVLSSSRYDESDQNAEEQFAEIMAASYQNNETEVDKVISLLKSSADFIPDESVTTTLQPMVQWICDLSLTLLSSVPVYSIAAKTGSLLAKDVSSLVALREMLVVSCDVIAKLFKLMTMLLTSVRKGEAFSDSLLDECSLLQSQVILPPFDKSFCWNHVPAQINNKPHTAASYTFGFEPDGATCIRLPFGQHIFNGKKDIFTHIEVNNQFKDGFKKCIRCHAATALTKPISEQKTRMSTGPVMPHYCLCGGIWTLIV